MNLSTLDWGIIIAFFVLTLCIGLWSARRASRSTKEFFLSGRDMPWWLLGVSMVATTFSADTPNLVTNIVRENGVAGNWVWWAFLLTGMTTVFVYAKLWRRSGITTDLEFYELRYSGPEARFLRGFRAIYLGVFFNVMIMATVLLAGIKISNVMLGLGPVQTVVLVSVVTVIYSGLGGLRGVILTDFFQFILSMIGMILAAIYIVSLPEIGGLEKLISHPMVADKRHFLPDLTDMEVAVPLFFIPIAVQWWSIWYPGAEPGGGGYVAQRMLSAEKEKDAVKATLFFNVAHYALRPWPWILIAMASLVVFPELSDIKTMFPAVDDSVLGHDLAFPAMLTYLPQGLIGLVIASLIAALMSTISTHLNWGASYIVHDFYKRFLRPEASESSQVVIGRMATAVLMIFAAVFALALKDALGAFNILLQIGAGTGLLFILRWFWWRINAYSEITAMIVSFMIAVYFELFYGGTMAGHMQFITGVVLTTLAWVAVTFMTRPTDMMTLTAFYKLIRPHGSGWSPVLDHIHDDHAHTDKSSTLATDIFMAFVGCVFIYTCLFGVGYILYGHALAATITLGIAGIALVLLVRLWRS